MEVQRAYTFQTNGGDKGIITFAKDGILSVTITNGWVDSGVWRTEGETICLKWVKRGNGKESCQRVRDLNGDKIQLVNVESKNKGAVLTPKN
jgi:hypothetical protein